MAVTPKNKWIGYLDRSIDTMMTSIKSRLKTNVPEITDHSDSSFFIQLAYLFTGIAETLHYYIDGAARESFLETSRLYESAIYEAMRADYKVTGAIAATVDLTFTLSAVHGTDVLIPAGTECSTDSGVVFTTLALGTIVAGQTEVTVSAKQFEAFEDVLIGQTDGTANQKIFLEEDNIVHDSISLTVNAIAYAPVETFATSISTDKHFRQNIYIDKKTYVEFGDDLFAIQPLTGLDVVADYQVSIGAAGNVAAETITTIDSDVTVPAGKTLTVTNDNAASGGSPVATLEQLKKKLPIYYRTRVRMVADDDFEDLTQLAPGVSKAGAVYNCGKELLVYISPVGGGIASQSLIDDTQEYVDERKPYCSFPVVQAAGEVDIKLEANIRIRPEFSISTKQTELENLLIAFLSAENQEINGTVRISDIYEIIETTDGIAWSEINVFSTVPYARPIDGTANSLDWSVETQASSTNTIKWRIKMVTISTFQLYKKEGSINPFVYLGTFNVDTLISQGVVKFTVNSGPTYLPNEQWEFVTYRYFGNSLILDEPSVPVAKAINIVLNVSGGV